MMLDCGEHVTVLTRDAKGVEQFARRGATVYVGDLEDKSFVKDATRGAEILYWATPQAYDQEDLVWFQHQLGRNVARAILSSEIPRVVNISSIGAQHESETGVIKGLREVEQLIDETGTNIVHLRAGYFMENFLFSLPEIRETGKISLPVDGAVERPMIATIDIAVLAANLLCDPEWTGREVREIVGPKYVSFNRAAEIIGEVLERPVEHVTIPPDRARKAMTEMGWSKNSAELMLELYDAMAAGLVAPEGTPYQTMTTLRRFARTRMRRPATAQA
jgi:uncharacterized protein YbjT (DUF2867 family)